MCSVFFSSLLYFNLVSEIGLMRESECSVVKIEGEAWRHGDPFKICFQRREVRQRSVSASLWILLGSDPWRDSRRWRPPPDVPFFMHTLYWVKLKRPWEEWRRAVVWRIVKEKRWRSSRRRIHLKKNHHWAATISSTLEKQRFSVSCLVSMSIDAVIASGRSSS